MRWRQEKVAPVSNGALMAFCTIRKGTHASAVTAKLLGIKQWIVKVDFQPISLIKG